jgi:adenine-specific DNA-methyltransferase
MLQKFYSKLEKLLKKDPRFIDQEGDLLKSNVIDSAYKADKKLMEVLLSQREFKNKFFSKIKDALVFNINDFVEYISDKNFLADSYTKYRNKIGLNIDEKFLNERKEVALVWPFKDCVLEGGMTKEDEKRKEIFFNEILAQDEIDKLFSPKVLTNWKRYTQKGEQKVRELKRDKDGTIRENLIIKGNNLLALHSLKQQFQNKVKLIYIDPPYNIGGDFQYNDSFNHSTWLTFMKNRLEIAKQLLSKNGAIFVQIDHHEVAYLNALMDEVFGAENKVQIITVKVSAASGFKAVNPGPIDVTEFILFYTKSKNDFIFSINYIETGYHRNYNLFLKKAAKIEEWKLLPLKKVVLKENGYKSEKELKDKYGAVSSAAINKLISDFAFSHADEVVSIRDLHKPSDKVRELQEKSRKHRNKIIPYKKQNGTYTYLINGGALAFYSSKIKKIDGEFKVTELLTNFWNHISWAGIAREGGVKLKNSKKPEKLIRQVIEAVGVEGDDIIMDFFLGSGTTSAIAHKLNVQYLGIEQLDYEDNDTVVRLRNVINGDKTGISKAIGWKGGGDFIYCELMKYNEQFVEKIKKAKNTKMLLKIWEEMKKKSFLNYNVDIKKFNETIDEFKKLLITKQKRTLFDLLNKNQLYINLSEIKDKDFKVGEGDKKLNKEFYKKV